MNGEFKLVLASFIPYIKRYNDKAVKRLSVCIAACNGEKFISEQISSILEQLSEDDEIIISDDGSTDNTVEIVEKYHDDRIIILKDNNFKSPVRNFEKALKQAKGEFVFLADQDDIWEKDKLNIIMGYLAGYDVVVSDCRVIDEKDNVIYDSFFHIRNSGKGIFKNLVRNSYIGCCMAFNRKILEISLPFPKNIPMHDLWIGIIGELFGKCYFCDEKLVRYRRHKNNITNTGGKSNYGLLTKISFRLSILKCVILRVSGGKLRKYLK